MTLEKSRATPGRTATGRATLSPAETDVLNVLDGFAPITLDDMDTVRLLDRVDTKFVFPAADLPALLSQLPADQYRCLTTHGHRLITYETTYYDDPTLNCYHAHRTGRTTRYKIRQRHYVQSGETFVEVKRKDGRGRTTKHRLALSSPNGATLDAESQAFASRYVAASPRPFDPATLQAALWVRYDRLTLVNLVTAERLTFDLGLTFWRAGRSRTFAAVVVAELKQAAHQPSPFRALMKAQQRRAGGLSKYCLGMISVEPALPHNRFKPRLSQFGL